MPTISKEWRSGKMVKFEIDGRPQPLTDEPEPKPKTQFLAPRGPQAWPLLLTPLKLWAKDGDRGAGDIIARRIGPLGGDAFKSWYLATFGRKCGCDLRQESWNRKYPL